MFCTSITSAAIGAWKCNIPPFCEIMADRPTDPTIGKPTNRQTYRPGHREVKLPILLC